MLRASSIFETEPVDLPDQPLFLNCVVEIEAALEPLVLLVLSVPSAAASSSAETTPSLLVSRLSNTPLEPDEPLAPLAPDRKSTRLNSSR